MLSVARFDSYAAAPGDISRITDLALTFRAVDETSWDDLALLFEERGGPKNCWCMAWRRKPPEGKTGPTEQRKAALKGALHGRVAAGEPIGVLAYHDDRPVAWCSIAPRATHRTLGGPDDHGDDPNAVWSVTCFFVKRALRGQRIRDRLLNAALREARAKGAKIVEAYPVDRDSPSYRFMGIVDAFEQAGFKKIGHAGSRRYVVRLSL